MWYLTSRKLKDTRKEHTEKKVGKGINYEIFKNNSSLLILICAQIKLQ